MTPEEKSEDLINKMLFEIEYNCQPSLSTMVAKQCALIAVDEILEILEGLNKPEYAVFDAIEKRKYAFEGEYTDHMTGYDMVAYFQEVKQEIEKL